MRRLVALCILAVVATATAVRADYHDDPVRYRDPVFEDVARTGPHVYDEALGLALDLFEPYGDAAPARAAIVLAHGGGFRFGSREEMADIAVKLARHGFVAASISYRLDPDLGYEELIVGSLAGELPPAMHNAQHDMQSAVRWLRENAAELRVDPAAITAGGVSAGASMALETAFNPEDDADDGDVSSAIAGAVSLSGATDPRRIEPGAPPVALFNGVLDTTAPFPTAAAACVATIAHGNVCELTPYPDSGHDLHAHEPGIIDLATDFLCAEALEGCAA